MKLTVRNLGRIREAELDIKPLTVLFGPNNTNKTWTMYALWEAMRRFSASPVSYVPLETGPANEDMERAIEAALRGLLASLDETPAPARAEASLDLESLVKASTGEGHARIGAAPLAQTLGVPKSLLDEASVSLAFSRWEMIAPYKRIDVVLERPLNRIVVSLRREANDGSPLTLTPLVSTTTTWTKEFVFAAIRNAIARAIDNIVVLPAERHGIAAALDALPNSLDWNVGSPVIGFMRLLLFARARAPDNEDAVSPLDEQLSRVLGGSIVFEGSGAERRLVFRTADGVAIPIHAASSLSRAVSGLSLYLRYFVRPDDLLLIDELEMNAHPKAQLALVELMAMLANSGVRVVFTTHSPYVTDHINNLMEAARVPTEKREEAARHFELGSADAFLDRGNVAAYRFEEQSDGSVAVKDAIGERSGIITDTTFGPSSEKVLNLFSEMLDMQPQESLSSRLEPEDARE